ncbi:hypothetical protein SeMB42_g01541 [Synchytrium endobioticum]|uniref:HMG box domain-containing protein n=1 Tax=Synchytrium endobioticum TaxID=286115 RepID=A0A507DKV5_9FUNG|nr:hypothetical protein SeLEV6574_g04406 [Synchytrium endobioticum]TPX52284.1 hypothetical protein SeMB42_g01541 [Synchytrium endobioticum]
MPKEAKEKTSRASRKGDGKKVKKAKDPHAPKKALTAFMLFSKEYRPKIKEENPDVTFGDVGKLLGAAWNKLSDKEKEPFKAKEKDEKARYEVDIAKYNASKAGASAGGDDEEDADDE